MKISVLCSDALHPVNAHLEAWVAAHAQEHRISIVRRKAELPGGDILFLVSCGEIIHESDRAGYRVSLVLHASDLPRGRGWSPHVWEIISGADQMTVSLLEVADPVDSGRIWRKLSFPVPPDALWDDINTCLFEAEIELINFAVTNFNHIEPTPQDSTVTPSYYRRRTPDDSRIDPEKSIASQFDRIRVCDPQRYPAFFELYGKRYKLTLEKIK
jgi:methionyl-tRNA formyltransferase